LNQCQYSTKTPGWQTWTGALAGQKNGPKLGTASPAQPRAA
jgi:hypothetical protein